MISSILFVAVLVIALLILATVTLFICNTAIKAEVKELELMLEQSDADYWELRIAVGEAAYDRAIKLKNIGSL